MIVSEPAPPELHHRTAAFRLTFGLLLCFLLVVVHAAVDHTHRAELERITNNSAVGDKRFYHPPEPAPATPVSAGTFQGQSLVPLSYKPVDERDSHMYAVGEDDAGQLRVYVNREPAPTRENETEHHNEPGYFIKIANGTYLKVQLVAKPR